MADCCSAPGLPRLEHALKQILDALPNKHSYQRLTLKKAFIVIFIPPLMSPALGTHQWMATPYTALQRSKTH